MYQSVLSWCAHFLGPVYMHNNTFLKRCFSMYLAFHTHVNSTGTPDTFLQKINSQHIQKRIECLHMDGQ